LVHHYLCRQAGEEVTDRAIEVEEQRFGLTENPP
jgi:hypothetical protein